MISVARRDPLEGRSCLSDSEKDVVPKLRGGSCSPISASNFVPPRQAAFHTCRYYGRRHDVVSDCQEQTSCSSVSQWFALYRAGLSGRFVMKVVPAPRRAKRSQTGVSGFGREEYPKWNRASRPKPKSRNFATRAPTYHSGRQVSQPVRRSA